MNNVHNSRRLWLTTRCFFLGLSALFLAWSPFAQGVQSVTMAWDRSTDSTVSGYKLYYTDVATGTTSASNAGNASSNTVSGLLETKTYSFNVVAYNASGVESLPSNLINYTVPSSTGTPLMVIEAPVISTTNVVVGVPVTTTVRLPSLTVTVMVAVPVWLRTGVTVTVRLAPEPPKTMLALGTKAPLEDAPVTIRLPGVVCASPTVKAIGAVAVFWLVDKSAMLEMVGGLLGGAGGATPTANGVNGPLVHVLVGAWTAR